MHPIQVERLRTMTPGERLERAGALYRTAREVKAAGLRLLHPDWTEDQIREAVRRVFLRAHT